MKSLLVRLKPDHKKESLPLGRRLITKKFKKVQLDKKELKELEGSDLFEFMDLKSRKKVKKEEVKK